MLTIDKIKLARCTDFSERNVGDPPSHIQQVLVDELLIPHFTAVSSQSYEYNDEKITQILSSRYVCQAVSQLEFAP